MPTQLIGNVSAATRLLEVARQHHPRHAYLLTGPEHVGKRTLARQAAGALLCEKVDGPCDGCASCSLRAVGNHPDYGELDKEDKAGINEVRAIKQRFGLKPHSAPFRVAVIADAQRLGLPAQNAMLKLLEEPPPRTVLILTAGSPEQLLATTVSRCHHLPLAATKSEEIAATLGLTPEDEAIQAAQGRPGLAITLTKDPLERQVRQDWQQLLERIVTAPAHQRLTLAKTLVDDERLSEIWDYWISIHRHALHAELGLEEPLHNTPATALAKLFSLAQLTENLQTLVAARRALRYNPNVLLLVENTLLKLGT